MSTERPSLDLNADLGEGFGPWAMGDDAVMLEVVTTANVACGGHAGDPATMRTATRLAAQHGVAITAHVSYPDLVGFGRRFVDMTPGELTATVIAQAGALHVLAATAGTAVRGVKPHGALYNAIAHHEQHAGAVVQAVRELSGAIGPANNALALIAAPGSVVARRARQADLPVVLEAFADRAYQADGTLVPRQEEGAMITDEDAVVERVLRMATEGRVRAVDGSWVELGAHSICLHGDTPGAVGLARAVRAGLEEAGIELRSAL